MKKLTMLFLIMFCLTIFTYTAEKEWTVMVYICGDNDLDQAMFLDVNEMEKIGSSENVNIIVLHDRFSGEFEYGSNGTVERPAENKGMKIYYIEKDNDMRKINSKDITADLGFTAGMFDSGSAENLEKFIKAAMENYPAKKYHLDIGTHGGGIYAINTDYTSDTRMTLGNRTANSLSAALGRVFGNLVARIQERNADMKLDVLSFDACLMSMLEVYNEIAQHKVDFGVASEQSIPGYGFVYDDILNGLSEKTPENHTKYMVQSFSNEYAQGAHLASIKLDKDNLSTLAGHLGTFFELSNRAFESLKEKDEEYGQILMKEFHKALRDIRKFDIDDFVDIVDFVNKMSANEFFKKILEKDDLQNLIKNTHNMNIVANGHGYRDSRAWKESVNGLSMYMPQYKLTIYARQTEDGPQIVRVTSNGNLSYANTLRNFDFASTKMYTEADKFVTNYLTTMETVENAFFDLDKDAIIRWIE